MVAVIVFGEGARTRPLAEVADHGRLAPLAERGSIRIFEATAAEAAHSRQCEHAQALHSAHPKLTWSKSNTRPAGGTSTMHELGQVPALDLVKGCIWATLWAAHRPRAAMAEPDTMACPAQAAGASRFSI